MDWSNLLSATVRALIGAVGVIVAAQITIDRTLRARRERFGKQIGPAAFSLRPD